MKLLTDELRKELPPLYSKENEKDPLVICKFFLPIGCEEVVDCLLLF